MNRFGYYAVGTDPASQKHLKTFCHIFGWLCTTIKNFANIGASPWNDPTTSAIVDARVGSWASLKQIVHYGQIFKTGIFKDYDYGSDKNNVAVYGNRIIPEIPINSITQVPIAYFVGGHDDLADPTDTAYTYKKIPSTFTYNLYDDMDHYSFQVGKDMKYTADVLTLVKKYAVSKPWAETVEETLA